MKSRLKVIAGLSAIILSLQAIIFAIQYWFLNRTFINHFADTMLSAVLVTILFTVVTIIVLRGRYRAEAELRKSTIFLTSIFDSITDFLTVQDTNHNVIKANSVVEEIFGQDVLGRKCYQVYHRRDTVCLDCPMDKVLTRREPACCHEQENLFGRIIELWLSPIKDHQGNITAVIEHGRDVTEEKEMELALRTSEERYRSLVNNIRLGIFRSTLNPEGRFVEVNQTMTEITGYSREELLQMKVAELYVNPEEREQILSETILSDEQVTREICLKKKDGTEIIVADTKTVLKNEGGEVIYVDGIMEDITELRKTKEQLRHSQLLASLGEMTAGIAHEVNNPLGSILLYSELLMAGNAQSQSKKDLKIIHDEAKRAARIMTDLLTYSRKSKSRIRQLDLHTILSKVLDIRKYEEKVRNITVSVRLMDGPLNIEGDPSQLMQVFMNLVLNAEEAIGRHNGGNIIISTHADQKWAKVSIADDGTGVLPEYLSQVFYPFFTTKEVGEGAGLGLSACYGIVTDHNGLIKANNNDMGGATFTVELPLANNREEATRPDKKRISALLSG